MRERERTAERDARREARQTSARRASGSRSNDSGAESLPRRPPRTKPRARRVAAWSGSPPRQARLSPRSTKPDAHDEAVAAVVSTAASPKATLYLCHALEDEERASWRFAATMRSSSLGSVKMTVPRTSARPCRSARECSERVQVAIRGDVPEVEAKSEIDLRGFRAGEIEDLVMHAVDSAVRADLKTLRIIHGKGTGALRERVAEMLRKETPRVELSARRLERRRRGRDGGRARHDSPTR